MIARSAAGKAIEDGMYNASIKDRMATLESEKASLLAEGHEPDVPRWRFFHTRGWLKCITAMHVAIMGMMAQRHPPPEGHLRQRPDDHPRRYRGPGFLHGLKERLLAPELLGAFIEAFQAEVAEHQKRRRSDQAAVASKLSAIERKIAGILKAIEDGKYNTSMKERMAARRKRRLKLFEEVYGGVVPVPPVS